VSDAPVFRADLYRGTSRYYDEYRLPYPQELIDDLCSRTSLQKGERLLDVACGPGTVTFALADRFDEVIAVDLEPEAIELAERRAAAVGIDNVMWVVGRAEDVDIAADDVFDLVTIGTAFHRLHRRHVADRAMQWLRPGGYLALLWATTPLHEGAEWQWALREIVVGWMERLGATDRVPADLGQHLTDLPNDAVLEQAGFEVVGHFEFACTHDWTVDAVIGFVYSTSMLPRSVVGDHADDFERDVRARLSRLPLREDVMFAYDLARRN
jgi:ubiquinone/menaquinone biosynthesis C-methylase UbiE